MTIDELKGDLRAILAEEERQPTDWDRIRKLCLRTTSRLQTETHPLYPYEIVDHFLDEPDLRREDGAHGRTQRARLRCWLAAPTA